MPFGVEQADERRAMSFLCVQISTRGATDEKICPLLSFGTIHAAAHVELDEGELLAIQSHGSLVAKDMT